MTLICNTLLGPYGKNYSLLCRSSEWSLFPLKITPFKHCKVLQFKVKSDWSTCGQEDSSHNTCLLTKLNLLELDD